MGLVFFVSASLKIITYAHDNFIYSLVLSIAINAIVLRIEIRLSCVRTPLNYNAFRTPGVYVLYYRTCAFYFKRDFEF